jgi:hypothetical protein
MLSMALWGQAYKNRSQMNLKLKWKLQLSREWSFQLSKVAKKLIQELEMYLHQQLDWGMDFDDFNYMVQLHLDEEFTPWGERIDDWSF